MPSTTSSTGKASSRTPDHKGLTRYSAGSVSHVDSELQTVSYLQPRLTMRRHTCQILEHATWLTVTPMMAAAFLVHLNLSCMLLVDVLGLCRGRQTTEQHSHLRACRLPEMRCGNSGGSGRGTRPTPAPAPRTDPPAPREPQHQRQPTTSSGTSHCAARSVDIMAQPDNTPMKVSLGTLVKEALNCREDLIRHFQGYGK